MVKKLFVIFFFLIIPISSIQASIKQEIIANLKKTNNLVFDFTQTIAEKEEKGSCTIEYPKKFIVYTIIVTKKLWSLMANH